MPIGPLARGGAFAILVFALAGSAHAENVRTLADRIGALMKAAAAKTHAGDRAGTVVLLDQAERIIKDNPTVVSSFQGAYASAEIAQAHGDVVREGKLGDPCPDYVRARIAALRTQDMTANDGEGERRDAVAALLSNIDRSAGLAACPAPPPSKTDPAYVGHYYLSGVMETGSELLLSADGTFQWYMSYGAVDQTAHGAWGRDGGAIILVPELPSKDKPLFTFREIEPWSEAAEDELLRRSYDTADDKVFARCPFLGSPTAVAAAPTLPPMGDEAKPSPATLRAEASSALERALTARAEAEELARAEFADPPNADDAVGPHQTASEAISSWEVARWEAIDTARKAGLPEPELTPPALPEACVLSKRETAASIAPARWTGGIGVRVYDMTSEQGARDVKVTLRFANGQRTGITTARRGLALLPGKLASPVVAVDLAADYAPGRDQSIAVKPTSSGIIHFTIDAEQISLPPFTILRLRIDGRALILDASGRGRYERQP